jgi:protein-S-isoprenylcysteine O-methyltransferase Ste14
MVAYSIISAKNRIWPPPSKNSWQYKIYWNLFYLGVILDIILVILEYNTWIIADEFRYYVGLILIAIGTYIVCSAIYTLGLKNTYGLEDGFINQGVYKYSRNPQYVGDIILIIGLIVFINSLHLSILLILTIIIFIMMPLSEESWLEEKYRQKYIDYKNHTPRFL